MPCPPPSVWYELPTPRGTRIGARRIDLRREDHAERVTARRSTQAPKIFPVATDTHLSQGSAWMPRVVPTASLNEMLF